MLELPACQALLQAAADTRSAPAVRAAALSQLQANLSHALQLPRHAAGLKVVSPLWRPTVALLWDAQQAVRDAAADAVAALGAFAAAAATATGVQRPGRPLERAVGRGAPAGGQELSPNVLLDWALPLLGAGGDGGRQHVTVDVMAAVLRCISEYLRRVPEVAAAPQGRGERLVGAVVGLLEAEDTAPRLVPLLLPLLQWAAGAGELLQRDFRDVVDLLLGWCLEPQLPVAARRGIADTFRSCRRHWHADPPLAAALATNLVRDLEALVAPASTPQDAPKDAPQDTPLDAPQDTPLDAPSLARLIGLAGCLAAILAGSQPTTVWRRPEHVPRLLAVLQAAMAAGVRQQVAGSALEVCALVAELHATWLAAVSDLQLDDDGWAVLVRGCRACDVAGAGAGTAAGAAACGEGPGVGDR